MAFVIGDTVGPYRITDQVGQGGMATVYKAYHANLDRYVAFKVLHPAFKEDSTFLERFRREARIVARLEHPHIVPVYDFADSEGQPYLVMKFVEGETLKARLKRQPLTLNETLHILESVAAALTYAHDQGILHRDIKPSNIMLDQNGTPYIADFGLARIAQAGESTMSQDMMLGTPQYISPEQAKGVHDLGPSTDIYSLGVVLYELVVGRVPFSADTPYAIVHDHIYKALPLPSKVNPAVPLEVERVLLKALAKEPEARYKTAVDMVAAFREAVAASGLTELSATRYRPPAVSSSAVTLPDAVSPLPTPSPQYVLVPSPITPRADSTASKRAYRRRANLWIMSGFGAFLLICLASLFIIVSAVSDPDLRPWNVEDKPEPETQTAFESSLMPGPFGDVLNTALEGAIAVDPAQNPEDFLYIASSQMQGSESGTGQGPMMLSQAITTMDIPSEKIVEVARRADAEGRADVAAWLYLEALIQDDVPPPARNEAGAYLYQAVQVNPLHMRAMLERFRQDRSQAAPVHILYALALLADDRVLNRREALTSLNTALEIDDELAEVYLVRGLYYQQTRDINLAQADWHHALSLEDVPDWVRREAARRLDETTDS